MGDISLRPFSPGVVLGRRRGTAGTANARAPTRGSGRVGFARAHTSALRQPLVVVRVDFFLLDFQSTLMPFDES